jgi:saccharopine dehydrogenase-like NADP-dependent oxidoreductase
MKIMKLMLLGAYGNFGLHITAKLAAEKNIQLILAGRSEEKCKTLAMRYQNVPNIPWIAVFDIDRFFEQALKDYKPDAVIHTCGPFQGQNYGIAQACIDYGCHYIDLADGRSFVDNIEKLNDSAQKKGVCVISGASSVPCLTAAVIDKMLPEFKQILSIDSGIATSQRINVGLATIRGTLSYCGKPIQMLKNGFMQTVYGWQGMVRREYPQLGKRFLAYCDVPDLALFPKRYPGVKSVAFRVSLEVSFVQWCMWVLSFCVRMGMITRLPQWASLLRRCSHWVDFLSTDNSGFHVQINGVDSSGENKQKTFYLIAKDRFGPYIPSTPAIICAKMLANNLLNQTGAYACLGVITLDDYLAELDSDKIVVIQMDDQIK